MPESSASAQTSATRTFLLSVLIGGWLLATLAGLWWFQQQNVRPFIASDDDLSYLRPALISERIQPLLQQLPAAGTQQTTLIHFWNPDCLCNQLSQRHFDGLIAAFDESQMRILVVAPATTSDRQLEEFSRLNGTRMQIVREPDGLNLPASPALALITPQGELGYFGAYGFGALCTVASDDFFPAIVRKMRAAEPYGPFANVAGSGCFCHWPTSKGAG